MAGLTPKQEGFCHAYIETGNASEAYRQNYNVANMKETTIGRNAHALLANNKIATKIDSIKAALVAKHEVTVDSILLELDGAVALAKSTKQATALTGALMAKAKLAGLITDRSDANINHTGLDAKAEKPDTTKVQALAASFAPSQDSTEPTTH